MIRVQTEDFDPGAEIAALSAARPGIGALVSFVGLVRDVASDASVRAMTLEHYAPMTLRALAAIEEEGVQRFGLEASLIIHRHGRLYPGERIVLAVAAAAHRAPAFGACAFMVDRLKTEAPFWKCEETPRGFRWVDARAEDAEAAGSWR